MGGGGIRRAVGGWILRKRVARGCFVVVVAKRYHEVKYIIVDLCVARKIYSTVNLNIIVIIFLNEFLRMKILTFEY